MPNRISTLLRSCLLVSTFLAAASLPAAAGTSGAKQPGVRPMPWLFVGGRAGVAYELATQSQFNATIQTLYPSTNTYFPLYSVLGIALTERIPIGHTGYRLLLVEQPMVAGIDQNYALPSFTFLVGMQTNFGLEAGLGPEVQASAGSSGVVAALSLVYSIGWRFSMGTVSFPISLMIDPIPPHRHPRAALTFGIDYGFAPSLPRKPRPPFNY